MTPLKKYLQWSLIHFIIILFLFINESNALNQRPPMIGSSSLKLSNNNILTFGGYYSEKQFRNEFFNDLWIFHINNASWQLISQNENDIPKARAFHSLNIINETHALLFGGTDTVSQVQESQGFAGSCQLNDIWLLDLESFKWTQIENNHKVSFQGFDYEICTVDKIDSYISVDAIVSYVLLFGLTFFAIISILLIRFITK